jgi:thiol peroxidase
MEILREGELFSTIEPVVTGPAPDFTIDDVTLSDLKKPVIISVFPDINTRVCAFQTKRFNKEAAGNPDIDFVSISNNTKAEQASWCAAEGVDMTILSDFDNSFGLKYGIVMPKNGRLARSVFVVKDMEIVYAEICNEMTNEPDYEAVLKAAQVL